MAWPLAPPEIYVVEQLQDPAVDLSRQIGRAADRADAHQPRVARRSDDDPLAKPVHGLPQLNVRGTPGNIEPIDQITDRRLRGIVAGLHPIFGLDGSEQLARLGELGIHPHRIADRRTRKDETKLRGQAAQPSLWRFGRLGLDDRVSGIATAHDRRDQQRHQPARDGQPDQQPTATKRYGQHRKDLRVVFG
ncbi:MAG TPA: hypothetical protein VFM14_06690 [Gemmatimonadales bacterium]|nr:hypothetical protein [Gemmatimonadales bacterium]